MKIKLKAGGARQIKFEKHCRSSERNFEDRAQSWRCVLDRIGGALQIKFSNWRSFVDHPEGALRIKIGAHCRSNRGIFADQAGALLQIKLEEHYRPRWEKHFGSSWKSIADQVGGVLRIKLKLEERCRPRLESIADQIGGFLQIEQEQCYRSIRRSIALCRSSWKSPLKNGMCCAKKASMFVRGLAE